MTNLTTYQPAHIIEAEIVTESAITQQHTYAQNKNIATLQQALFNIREVSRDKAIAMWLLQFKSEHTKKQYKRAVEKFFAWYPVNLSEVTPEILGNYVAWIKFNYVSQNTIAVKVNSVKSFFKYCTSNRFIVFSPAEAAKSISSTNAVEERILQDNDVAKILAVSSSKLPPVFGLLIRFLAETGARISEALNATFVNANGSNNFRQMSNGNYAVFLSGKGGKKREIAVSKNLFLSIRNLSKNNNLFNGIKGGKLSYSTAYSYLKKALKLAKLNSKISFHWLRHFAAKGMLGGGSDIKEVSRTLGHASISTTSIYLDLLRDDISLNQLAI